jgi:predicted amino acid-binding ACT domain protein
LDDDAIGYVGLFSSLFPKINVVINNINVTLCYNFFTLAMLISAATGGHVVYQSCAAHSRKISLRDESAEKYISFKDDL